MTSIIYHRINKQTIRRKVLNELFLIVLDGFMDDLAHLQPPISPLSAHPQFQFDSQYNYVKIIQFIEEAGHNSSSHVQIRGRS